ncbi:hypothetical protein NKI19_32330 [Mesorhizobium sp. M0751]|uniref:hypothetical protein n=1 Tax=unclassified Mesorhizobium TaxID=325217 RepID=UPI003337D96F
MDRRLRSQEAQALHDLTANHYLSKGGTTAEVRHNAEQIPRRTAELCGFHYILATSRLVKRNKNKAADTKAAGGKLPREAVNGSRVIDGHAK